MSRSRNMRKAYLKRFASHVVKPKASQRRAEHWLENAQEAASKVGTGEFQQMDADGFPVAERWHGGESPRKTVLYTLEQAKIMQSLRLQRVLEWRYVVWLKTKKQELRMYFEGNEYLLVEMDLYLEKGRRSIVFHDKEKLLRAYKTKAITWVESGPLRCSAE